MCFINFEMISRWLRARDSMWGHQKCPLFNTAVSCAIQSMPTMHCWTDEGGQGSLGTDPEDVRETMQAGQRAREKGRRGERRREGGQKQRAFNCLEWAWQLRGEWREKKSPAVLISPALPFQSPPAPLLRPSLHPIYTRNLDWSVSVSLCACICVCAEVIWNSVCPLLCAYISFVFIYLLMRLSITCQCGGTWGMVQ